MKRLALISAVSLLALAAAAGPVRADVTIGLTLGTTGPTASMGQLYHKVFENLPAEIGGEKVKYVFVDDAGDPANAVKNARKFADEDKADVIIGSNTTPTCLAVANVANETKTPQLCLSPVVVPEDKRAWVYGVAQSVPVMVSVLVEHMKANGVKTIGFIGYADGWGDLCWSAIEKLAAENGIQIVAQERYNRPDTSVAAQVLKIMAAKPDAVFVGASATPAVLPHTTLKERGFKGNIYHTHGILGPDFIRVGGANVEGAYATSGPLMVAADLPDANPIKKTATDFFASIEAKYPQVRNSFAGYSYDAVLLLKNAIPEAKKKAKPGTAEFRQALRDALEATKEVVGTHAVYTMTPADHTGVDKRARVLVKVEGGAFKLAK